MSFFPANTEARRTANAVLAEMGLHTGHARIKECRAAPCAAVDVFHKPLGAKRGRKVFTVVLQCAPKYFYQDGAQFYDADTHARLMSLSSMVKGDHDMDGAKAARDYFMRQRPEYHPELERT